MLAEVNTSILTIMFGIIGFWRGAEILPAASSDIYFHLKSSPNSPKAEICNDALGIQVYLLSTENRCVMWII